MKARDYWQRREQIGRDQGAFDPTISDVVLALILHDGSLWSGRARRRDKSMSGSTCVFERALPSGEFVWWTLDISFIAGITSHK